MFFILNRTNGQNRVIARSRNENILFLLTQVRIEIQIVKMKKRKIGNRCLYQYRMSR